MVSSPSTVPMILSLNDLRESLPQAGDFLGSLLGWNISNEGDDNYIPHDALLNLAIKHGIPDSIIPKPISIGKAFTKAVVSARKQVNDLILDYIAKPTVDNSDKRFIVAVLEKIVDVKTLKIKFEQKAVITYDIDSEEWTVDDVYYKGILEIIKQLLEYYQTHTSDDIRAMMRTFADKYSIRLNPEGRNYFVPYHNNNELIAVQNFIEDLCPRNQIINLTLFRENQSVKTLNRSTQQSLEEDINSLLEDIEDFMTKSNCSDTRYQNGLDLRVQKGREIKQRIEMFSSILSFKSSELLQKLDNIMFLIKDPNSSELPIMKIASNNNSKPDDDDVGF